jgi:hypothetical protein
MIKHEFHINQGGYPEFKLEDNYWMLQDLTFRDIRNVREIIRDIELVMNGERETVDLEGYDTTIVECSKTECVILYDGTESLGPIPVQWILDLFKDWLDYLIAFEESKKNNA